MAYGSVPALLSSDRWIRRTTTASVVLLALIAAVVSYGHLRQLALRYGEGGWNAALIPFSIDGMVLASSMTLLLESRFGRMGGVLPWFLLIAGSTASLAANVAVAEPTVIARLVARWPAFALLCSLETLMHRIRCTTPSLP